MSFDWEKHLAEFGLWVVTTGGRIFLILILTVLAIKAIELMINRLFHRLFKNQTDDGEIKKRSDTLKSVFKNLLTVTILVVALMMILDQLGVEIGPILAAAGVLGIAVGFGAQQLVRDVIQGFFYSAG